MAPTLSPDNVLSIRRLAHISSWMRLQVEKKRTAGLSVLIDRRGRTAFLDTCGQADVARDRPLAPDTIFRVYSMTKPLTSVAVMTLYEEGCFQLDDPISRFVPAFADCRVVGLENCGKFDTVPAVRGITFRDLLCHTSGLTYGEEPPHDTFYRSLNIDFEAADSSLQDVVERAARLPLIAQPGTRWNYSISTDVLGYLIEVISGVPFERYLKRRVIDPLGMVDTDFHVPEGKHERLCASYTPDNRGGIELVDDPATSRYLRPPRIASGGGGLVSTLGDYARFCRFMLAKGEIDGARLLNRETVDLMTSNQLGGDIAAMRTPDASAATYEGIGFGLGFSVMLDPLKAGSAGTPGAYGWGGAASTAFWIDPTEEMFLVLMTQMIPEASWPFRRELRVLAYEAIVG